MEKYLVAPSQISSKLEVPPSKSQTLRAILFASLAKGKSVIENPLLSPDSFAMIDACKSFGAKISSVANRLEIEGVNGNISGLKRVDVKNSGIVLRFIGAIGALAKEPFLLTGDESIRTRRVLTPLLEGIDQLGGSYRCMEKNGLAPCVIQGPIRSGIVTIEGIDSQPVSALLIASIFLEGSTIIQVENPGEKPWVNLTLKWFDYFNIPYKNENFSRFKVEGKNTIEGFTYKVPGDFSTALFPIALAALTNCQLVVENLSWEDPQGDKKAILILQEMGANIEIKPDKIIVKNSAQLMGIEVCINDCVDAICMLAVVGCFAKGQTILKGATIARKKESNRLSSICKELKKMGADIEEIDDGLRIKNSPLKGANMFSHKDHRVAMALSVAALASKGVSEISDTRCVNKTYPEFIKDLKSIGANISCH